MQMNRREALKSIAIGSAAVMASPFASLASNETSAGIEGLRYPFALPDLPYAYDALDSFIDAETMTIHHTKHHAGYVTNLNKAIESATPALQDKTLGELLRHALDLDETVRTAVVNLGGGHANHALFWKILNPGEPVAPSGRLADMITADFGSLDECIARLRKSAMSVFGSGWAWLVLNEGHLEVESRPNQNSPLMDGLTPLAGIDVWEHAYYLKYQDRRADYVDAVLQHINWTAVAEQLPA